MFCTEGLIASKGDTQCTIIMIANSYIQSYTNALRGDWLQLGFEFFLCTDFRVIVANHLQFRER